MLRVENDLKPHNRETIRRILQIYKNSNRCCAIQATGTGKTYLILRLLEIFNDEGLKAIIFAPNKEIIRQTKRKMKKFGLANAEFYTYSKLSKMDDETIFSIKCDLIIADELHRTGAKKWGERFEYLMNSHKDAKIFGVTATPLRCADGRDMSEEYFGGNKACDIPLSDALVREIIPVMPVYVSALYTFEEEYNNMTDKIDKSNNTNEEKLELMERLKAAKQQLEKSNGVPQIIKKYITNFNGKYIVFCKDKTHLYAMKDVVVDWFRQAGFAGKVFEYPFYSMSSVVKKNFEAFQNNKEDGLKLLFVIDKLNEGLHLEDIQGCILLRTTTSNIIYYQQIGRAIDAGSNEKRVILDLVSNFNSLKVFNLKEELKKSVKKRRNGEFSDCTEYFEIEKFDVIDFAQDCIDVFQNIDNQIYGIVDATISEFEKFVDRYEVTSIPRTKEFAELRRLCKITRNYYRQGDLEKEKYDKLNSLGFIWNVFDEIFLKRFKILSKYMKETGDYSIGRNVEYDDVKLGAWVGQLRSDYTQGLLNDEKINKLNSIGFKWDFHKSVFDKKLNLLKECVNNNVELNYRTIYKGCKIGQWLFVTQRHLYNSGQLSEERYMQIKQCGIDLKDYTRKKFEVIDVKTKNTVCVCDNIQELSNKSEYIFGNKMTYKQLRYKIERGNGVVCGYLVHKTA